MFEDPVAQIEPQEVAGRQRKRILIVDDDEAQVFSLHYRLKKLGFETLTAYSGREALEIAADGRLDLVLLDLRLPDTDGFVVCQKLADSPTTCAIPIIILSAMESPDIVRRARSAGCEYYIRKPYDPNVLLTLIETALKFDVGMDW